MLGLAMANNVDKSEINLWMKEIIETIGLREPLYYQYFSRYIDQKNIKGLIEAIALYMNLPIKVRIEYVSNDYKKGKVNFETKSLTEFDNSGHSNSGIIAQVEIPESIPFYGTDAFQNYPINIKVNSDCLKSPQTFIMVMAHELSHILLYSKRHAKRNNEFFTDMVSMSVGFAYIFANGREVINKTSSTNNFTSTVTIHTQTLKYGYLSDEQFDFSLNYINCELNKNRKLLTECRVSIDHAKLLLKKIDDKYFILKQHLSKLKPDKNLKFLNNDTAKIISFFQPKYINDYDDLILEIKLKFQKFNKINQFDSKNKLLNTNEIFKDRLLIDKFSNDLLIIISDIGKDTKLISSYFNQIIKLQIWQNIILHKIKVNFSKLPKRITFKNYRFRSFNFNKNIQYFIFFSFLIFLIYLSLIFDGNKKNTSIVFEYVAPNNAQLDSKEVHSENIVKNNSLPNGTIISRNPSQKKSYGELNIQNSTTYDGVVKLVSLSSKKSVFTVYISANNSYNINNIEDGDYKLVFVLGNDWNENDKFFVKNASYLSFEENFNFFTSENGYQTYEVSLNQVVGGNASTNKINSGEFNNY